MSFNYQNFFDSMKSGIDPYVVDVQPTITYKLVTGQNSIDPYRGSSAGRVYDKQFHIYTSELILLCSGEVLGKNPLPEKSLIGEYRLSGKYIDYDKIDDPTFQNLWRKTTGEDRHEFSQGFTNFLMSWNHVPADVVGSIWTSVSGQAFGITGRNFATTQIGAPHFEFINQGEFLEYLNKLTG
jgi:hypothetical protein